MKTPDKNQRKQVSSETRESKAPVDKNKPTANKDKGASKNPDPTNPNRSPEKINEPYAKTSATFPGNKTTKTQTSPTVKKEKITDAGESEHHISVNKGDYDKLEDEYDDFELDTEDKEEEDEEDGETSSHYEDGEDEEEGV